MKISSSQNRDTAFFFPEFIYATGMAALKVPSAQVTRGQVDGQQLTCMKLYFTLNLTFF